MKIIAGITLIIASVFVFICFIALIWAGVPDDTFGIQKWTNVFTVVWLAYLIPGLCLCFFARDKPGV